jgi:acetylornithine deacetylase/succinyl-diaminopimelate desuccinylase-like protein
VTSRGIIFGLILICHSLRLLADSSHIERVAREPKIREALAYLDAHELQTGEFLASIAVIVSPSGHEQERAEAVAKHMRDIGLQNVSVDGAPNAVGIIPGRSPRTLVFTSILDDDPTDVKNQKSATRAPYVADGRVIGAGTDASSTTVAMLAGAEAIVKSRIRPGQTLIFASVSQVGTNYNGMRKLYAQYKDTATAFVDVVGEGRSIFYGALGIHWWKVIANGPAGHTLEGGVPNVNQAIARSVDRILSLQQDPPSHTVINVGMLQSGDAFNHRPGNGWFSLDIRSKDNGTIERIEKNVRTILDQVAKETSIGLTMESVSDTPAGQIAGERDSALVRTSQDIVKYLGQNPVLADWGVTNMNIAIANGTPAIALVGGPPPPKGGEDSAEISMMTRAGKEIVLLAATLKPPADPVHHE